MAEIEGVGASPARQVLMKSTHLMGLIREAEERAQAGDENAVAEHEALIQSVTPQGERGDDRGLESDFILAQSRARTVDAGLASRVSALKAAFYAELRNEPLEMGFYGEACNLRDYLFEHASPCVESIREAAEELRKSAALLEERSAEIGEDAPYMPSEIERLGGEQAHRDHNDLRRAERNCLNRSFYGRAGAATQAAIGAGAFQKDAPLLRDLSRSFASSHVDEERQGFFVTCMETWHALETRGYGRKGYPDSDFDSHLRPAAKQCKLLAENTRAIAVLFDEEADRLAPPEQVAEVKPATGPEYEESPSTGQSGSGKPDGKFDAANEGGYLPSGTIPSSYRTRPVSKKAAAKALGKPGGKDAVNWLSKCIEDGTISCERQSRQSFVFDLRQFPEEAKSSLSVTTHGN